MICQSGDIIGSLNINIREGDNKMDRIFFFDIDGTVYRNTVGVTEKTKKAFERLQKQGDYVFFSTGRLAPSIEPEFYDVLYDGYVGGNGTQIVFREKQILNIPMDVTLLDQVICFARQENRAFVLEGSEELYSDSVECKTPLFHYGFYKQLLGKKMREVDAKGRSANKITLILDDRPFEPKQYNNIMDRIKCIVHENECVEMGPKYCSKASGADIVLRSLGILRENSFAFGDSRNDLEILEYAGCGVAMGDAPDVVKEKADFVTGTVEEDGISRALECLGIWDT
ncbi:HAD family hydrolase [Lactonifactor longoviformis]|nr:HAD family hydrolase [Lactonifactor longoviformis]